MKKICIALLIILDVAVEVCASSMVPAMMEEATTGVADSKEVLAVYSQRHHSSCSSYLPEQPHPVKVFSSRSSLAIRSKTPNSVDSESESEKDNQTLSQSESDEGVLEFDSRSLSPCGRSYWRNNSNKSKAHKEEGTSFGEEVNNKCFFCTTRSRSPEAQMVLHNTNSDEWGKLELLWKNVVNKIGTFEFMLLSRNLIQNPEIVEFLQTTEFKVGFKTWAENKKKQINPLASEVISPNVTPFSVRSPVLQSFTNSINDDSDNAPLPPRQTSDCAATANV